jgi:hypothetical protein
VHLQREVEDVAGLEAGAGLHLEQVELAVLLPQQDVALRDHAVVDEGGAEHHGHGVLHGEQGAGRGVRLL